MVSSRAKEVNVSPFTNYKPAEPTTKPQQRRSGLWPKNKPLNQPPVNSQAKLQSDQPGKQAKLSRGAAI